MIILSTIPTVAYFVSCMFYNQFQLQNKKNITLHTKSHIINSSNNAIIETFVNIFVIHPLMIHYNDEHMIRYWYICLGMIIIDTIEYFVHYLFHYNSVLYNIHKLHHRPSAIQPYIALSNHNHEIIITVPMIILCFLYFRFTYIEYIIVITLGTIATVCDHTYTSPNKFHIIHHTQNKNTNFQQPFFTYWDVIFSTYNKKSKLKIPFIP